jgi:hypothetical protein
MDTTKKVNHAHGVTADKGAKSAQPPQKMDPSKPDVKPHGDSANDDGQRKAHNNNPDDQVGSKRQDMKQSKSQSNR